MSKDNVASDVLLGSSDYDAAADQKGASSWPARRGSFPSPGLMFGEIIFNWHIVATTNAAMSIAHLLVIYVTFGARCAVCRGDFIPNCAAAASARTHPEDRVFRCTKCGLVYTDDADVDRSRCTQCGKLNEPIVF